MSKTIHRDCHVPFPVVDITKTDYSEKGDPVIYGTVGEKRVYDVSMFGLKCKDAQIEEKD